MGSSNITLYVKWTIGGSYLFATGRNSYGQLGDGGTTYSSSSPVKVMEDVEAVAAGEAHTLILK